jgi:hypothetical protein
MFCRSRRKKKPIAEPATADISETLLYVRDKISDSLVPTTSTAAFDSVSVIYSQAGQTNLRENAITDTISPVDDPVATTSVEGLVATENSIAPVEGPVVTDNTTSSVDDPVATTSVEGLVATENSISLVTITNAAVVADVLGIPATGIISAANEINSNYIFFDQSGIPVIAEVDPSGNVTSLVFMSDMNSVDTSVSSAVDSCPSVTSSAERVNISESDNCILDNGAGMVGNTVEMEDENESQQRNENATLNKKSRKRQRNKENWKCNMRKKLRQSGGAYVDSNGNSQAAHQVNKRKHCGGTCRFHCTEKITVERQSLLFEHFWKLSDAEKAHFYARTTKRSEVLRSRSGSAEARNFAIKYFLLSHDDTEVRVCKSFYLSTLDISQRRISYFHETKLKSGFPRPIAKGNHVKASEKSECMKKMIREHINSIPRIASHYCRSRTSKEYVDGSLNLTRIYRLYVEKCAVL